MTPVSEESMQRARGPKASEVYQGIVGEEGMTLGDIPDDLRLVDVSTATSPHIRAQRRIVGEHQRVVAARETGSRGSALDPSASRYLGAIGVLAPGEDLGFVTASTSIYHE